MNAILGAAGLVCLTLGCRLMAQGSRTIASPDGKVRERSPISARELEVMTLLAKGLSKSRSPSVGIREQTVKNHVTRTMEKLGVENRTEVGLLAARHHLRLMAEAEPDSS